ncbi:MAG: metal-dependent transcriptional regulator [Gemmatimonadetes bacterium]|nr:MAG: metal-dependent transcriptional regulator [Gemmatimonadota bacterium]
MEDYLKHIYQLQEHTDQVTTSAIAQRMDVSAASVTDMIKKLSERGYLHYTPYRGVELTPEGRGLALNVLRKHRLWEVFLVEYLDFPLHQVHEEAEDLEHLPSTELVQRLDKLLGYPRIDPHGDPIPTADGTIEDQHGRLLAHAQPGQSARIVRVSDTNPELLRYLESIGLVPHTEIQIKSRAPFEGPMVVEVDGVEHSLGNTVMNHIFVNIHPR